MKTQLFLAFALAAQAQNPPAPAPGNVTLPLDQYNQLVERAAQASRPQAEPPFPAVLKDARLNLRVGAESVSGTVSLEGEVLAKGDQLVPLVRGMVVRESRQQGRDLPVEQQGGLLSAVLPGPAPFAVTLDAAVPLLIEPGRASFTLRAPDAGAVEATLSIPGEETQVHLSLGLITEQSSQSGRTIVQATLPPGQLATIWWASRLSSPTALAAPKEVRFLSDLKTLVTVGEAELDVAALAEITVVQGEPSQFRVQAPPGYELTGATGATLASSELQNGSILLNVSSPAARSHRFLISMARSNMAASTEVPLLSFIGTQRETGEVLVEGEGAMELTALERGALRRMDLKEADPYLRSMARGTLHTAFRYQKRPGEIPAVALEWVRFPNSKMTAAVAQEAVITTLVTSEGRSLTEVKLTLRNQSQPFLKVDLPAGASILSADVAGEKVKPVQGSDGSRVPLLRPGFRPAGAYTVTFVFLHAGAPFARKGGAELVLPKIDLPIARMEWEVYLPPQYKVADFAGDALPARLLALNSTNAAALPFMATYASPTESGGVGGFVTDPSGAVVAGARIQVKSEDTGVTRTAVSNATGHWTIPGVPPGRLTLVIAVQGFQTYVQRGISHGASQTNRVDATLQVGGTSETVTVTAEAPLLQTESAEVSQNFQMGGVDQLSIGRSPKIPPPPPPPPSANVTDLERRVSGVLPIAVNVPRTGASYRFVRALAVDEETKLTFRYRTK